MERGDLTRAELASVGAGATAAAGPGPRGRDPHAVGGAARDPGLGRGVAPPAADG